MRRIVLAILLLASFAAGQKRPFTFEDMMALKRIGDPQPSPDGKWVAFGAGGALWSPDGRGIVFTSTVWPECNAAGDAAAQDACNKQKDEAKATSKVKASIFTGLLYRHWNAYTGAKRSHLFVQSIAGDL